jgi:hypothetical protein
MVHFVMDIKEREIRLLVDDHDHVPFLDWFKGLRDTRAMVAINSRIFRAADGNLGTINSSAGLLRCVSMWGRDIASISRYMRT